MSKLHILTAIYLLLGLFGYATIGGVGSGCEAKRRPSIFRKVLAIILWPLAMVGAIEG